MRLLNTYTLTLTTFIGETPEYVILSHRWEDEEILFEDVMKVPISDTSNPARAKRGFPKLQGTCALALRDGFDWIWIDNCCIDKSSSAELQEAINSMFRWYQEAQFCYAYLSDVSNGQAGLDVAFKESLWFTRGWTLQELLAPCSVEFYAADWTFIGSKASRAEEIATITGIALAALQNVWAVQKDRYLAAEKMSWAAHRRVTKSEDMAYCLLGLFDVNMPLLYGEGGRRAFRRLQQVVFESEPDYTLFLFATHDKTDAEGPGVPEHAPLLAYSARQFCRRTPCKECAKQPTCLPDYIEYSRMGSVVDAQWNALNDPSLKLVKSGVQLKVPQTGYKPGLQYLPLTTNRYSRKPSGKKDGLVALLPLTLTGYKFHLFGIVLELLPTSNYARLNTAPIMVDMRSLNSDAFDPKALIVSDVFLSPVEHMGPDRALACFEFHSSSFMVSSWDSNYVHVPNEWKPESIFTMASTASHGFGLMIRTSSSSSRVSPVIILGDSIKNIRLLGVEVQGDDGSTSRLESEGSSLADRIIIPLESAQACIKVTLRRLCTTLTGHILDQVDVRLRIDVEYVADDMHGIEPGKMNKERIDAQTEDIDADELSVNTTAADLV
ncbi:uncharacterized protein J4E92_007551 [Alternaria infectoria]|uniref:uncharacterized protein n=1 Tax=Alternaria infectoria TaxID=45303 RepID=UPI00221F7E99|nr:uncharacterized protein J4E92_007551 [Alternaria infectoria]KAI4923577.1 hypothetical protein J4E92_007551 [Alternaria infectoria]